MITPSSTNRFRLSTWMHHLLKFGGYYNLLAGFSMIAFYHEGFEFLGLEKADLNLPIQLVGLFVMLFGVGYLMVDRDPLGNKNVLLLGWLSKLMGPAMACVYVAKGDLPLTMLPVLFAADIVYLIPFWMIYKRIQHENATHAQLGAPVFHFGQPAEISSADRANDSKRKRAA